MGVITGFLKWVFYLACLLFLGLLYFGNKAVTDAEHQDVSISPNILRWGKLAGIPIPQEPTECGDLASAMLGESSLSLRFKRALISVSFNSVVDDARSAETAALRYLATNNTDMAATAAMDALGRWRHALELRSEIRCAAYRLERQSY